MKLLTPEYAEKLFGDPTDKKTFRWMKLWIAPADLAAKAGPKFPKKIYMHIIAIPLWERIYRELVKTGLSKEIYSIGWYNVRKQKGSTRWSLHSWSLGPDINPKDNAQGTKGKMNPKIVEIFERNGFIWGGRFKGKKTDPMHFELSSDAVDAFFNAVLISPGKYLDVKVPLAWIDANKTKPSSMFQAAPEPKYKTITFNFDLDTSKTQKIMNNSEQNLSIPFPEEVLESLNTTRYSLELKLSKINAAIESVRGQINKGLNQVVEYTRNTTEGTVPTRSTGYEQRSDQIEKSMATPKKLRGRPRKNK